MILEDNLKLAKLVGGNEEASAMALSIAAAVRKEVEASRATKNIKPDMHWDFYHGFQEKYFVQRAKEPKDVFQNRKNYAKTTNYIRFVVDLDTRFLYGRPNKIGRYYGENKKTEDRMAAINKLNHIDNLQMEAKRQASIFGEQGHRLIPVDKRTGSQVEANTSMGPNVYPHAVPLDPRSTYFLLNPFGKPIAVVMVWKYTDYVDESRTVEVTELVTDDSRWKWHDDALQESSLNKYLLSEEFVLQKNSAESIDTVQDMLVLQTDYNECLTDNSYFFQRHGRPQLVSSVDLSAVIGQDNMVWEIKTDDEASGKILDQLGFLVWDGKMEAAMEHLDKLEAKLFKVSSTASISTGDLEGIGNLRSGAALETAHSPSIQKSKEQQIIWAENEENLANAIVAFDARIHGKSVEDAFPEYSFEMKFPADSGVPGSEILNAEVKQIGLNSHFTTLKDIIREDNPKFTKEKVDAYYNEIIEDSSTLVDALREFKTEEAPASSSGGSSQKKSAEQKKPKA